MVALVVVTLDCDALDKKTHEAMGLRAAEIYCGCVSRPKCPKEDLLEGTDLCPAAPATTARRIDLPSGFGARKNCAGVIGDVGGIQSVVIVAMHHEYRGEFPHAQPVEGFMDFAVIRAHHPE